MENETQRTFRPTRKQSDLDFDERSRAARTTITPEPQFKGRQEFKAESNINNILRNFGVGPANAPPQYGETDLTLDLQQSLHAIHDARQAYADLPKDVHEKYPTWDAFSRAIISGQIIPELEKLGHTRAAKEFDTEIDRIMKREDALAERRAAKNEENEIRRIKLERLNAVTKPPAKPEQTPNA